MGFPSLSDCSIAYYLENVKHFFQIFEKSFWVVLPSSCPSTLCSCSLWRLVHSEVCASGSCWFTFISRTTGLRAVVGLVSSGVLHGQLATSRSGSAPLTLRTEYTTFGRISQPLFRKFLKKFFTEAGSRPKNRASQPRTRGQKERAFRLFGGLGGKGGVLPTFHLPCRLSLLISYTESGLHRQLVPATLRLW